VAQFADAVVVGSAIVSRIAQGTDEGRPNTVKEVLAFCRTLADSVHAAKRPAVVD